MHDFIAEYDDLISILQRWCPESIVAMPSDLNNWTSIKTQLITLSRDASGELFMVFEAYQSVIQAALPSHGFDLLKAAVDNFDFEGAITQLMRF